MTFPVRPPLVITSILPQLRADREGPVNCSHSFARRSHSFFHAYRWPRTRAADTMCGVSDWRQIQARIRKARTSADPPGQLAALYERTRDAMVAFELAQFHEKIGANTDAARWYTPAAERLRPAQWKEKAAEARIRLCPPT